MKEFLESLGLSEEQVTQVVGHVEGMHMIPKARFDEVNNKKKALEEEVSKYEASLEGLKNSSQGAEDLKATIEKLQKEQSTLKTEYEQKLVNERLNANLKLQLNGKVHDIDLVASLINRESIKLDENGNVVDGLEEQITALKDSKTFLFVQENQPEEVVTTNPITNIMGWKPTQPPQQQEPEVSLGAQFAQMMNGK